MSKKVSRIYPVTDPTTTYFLQITWEKDLGIGFDVILSDGQLAWAGRVSKDEISKEVADMEMEREKYIEELQKLLLFREGQIDKYNFGISKGDTNADCIKFYYEKNLKDVSFRLGSLDLQKVSSPAEIIREIISYCLDSVVELQTKNEHLRKENERLLSDVDDLQGQLLKCVEAKEELESELYKRFILVLNEKKAKIRSLQQSLKEAEEVIEEATQKREVVPTSERKVEDYDGSTDEESENCIQSSIVVPAIPRRDSLLNSPDIADIAPSRKRRQRTQEAVGVEPKVASRKETVGVEPKVASCKDRILAKERPDSVPSKSSDKCLSSKKMPLETEKSTSDPEDLFDDI
ncbi:DNA repair protein XRCC4 isoform X2 [Sphaerodactylus townsendi]|nr:DNA repair protein XRCC4 isoform X2 [Sphaerodactylus townsendi]XP_048359722.1 DNA repair protein XRCC4 isoform X2 [Sphaerodactylus townsendi]